MRNALLLILLTLTGGPQTPAPTVEPSATVVTDPRDAHRLVSDDILGAWLGHWAGDPKGGGAMEMIVSPGIRPETVVAHITLVDDGREQTMRRQGRVGSDSVRFDLAGGGEIVVKLVDDSQLVGTITRAEAGSGRMEPQHGSVALSRLRR